MRNRQITTDEAIGFFRKFLSEEKKEVKIKKNTNAVDLVFEVNPRTGYFLAQNYQGAEYKQVVEHKGNNNKDFISLCYGVNMQNDARPEVYYLKKQGAGNPAACPGIYWKLICEHRGCQIFLAEKEE